MSFLKNYCFKYFKNQTKNKKIISNLKNQRGMNLLEIMIVIAVIGSIAIAFTTQIIGRLKKSRIQSTKITISNVQKAIDIFYTDCGFYPNDLDALMTAPGECSSDWGPDPYLKKFPPVDAWKKPLLYEKNESSFVLKSLGSDARPGGSGDKADISSESI